MTKRNTHKIDAAQEFQQGHFFVASIAEWRSGRDIEALIKHMRTEEFGFTVWWVPVPQDSEYNIKNFAPKVKGAVQVASYGLH